VSGLADMADDADPFVFPDMPPTRRWSPSTSSSRPSTSASKIITSLKCIVGTTHSTSASPTAVRHQPYRSKIHRSDAHGNDRGADAAVTIADGPSPIVKISPSN
jgi:hypothetical protein